MRPGNPKHIHTWADLTKPGVQVVTPDPFPSGGAKWNVLAAYGAQRKMGKTDKQATAYVQKLFHNVVQQDTSASNAMNTFLSGKGDVLLTYESEAYTALAAGKYLQIVDPEADDAHPVADGAAQDGPGEGDGVHQVLPLVRSAEALHAGRLPAGRQVGAQQHVAQGLEGAVQRPAAT